MPDVRLAVGAEGVVPELVLQRRLEGHGIGLVLRHRGREQRPIDVRVDGLHAGDPAPHLVAGGPNRVGQGADVVQVLHSRAVRPVLEKADREDPSGKDEVTEVVEVVEEGRDRLHGGAAVHGQHLRRVPGVGDPVGAHAPVRPGLVGDPVRDLSVVGDLVLGEFEAADPERGPASPPVHEDERVSGAVPALRLGEVRGLLEGDADLAPSAPVAGRPHHGREPVPRLDAVGQPHVDGDTHAVAHGDVKRLVAREHAHGALARAIVGGGGGTVPAGEISERNRHRQRCYRGEAPPRPHHAIAWPSRRGSDPPARAPVSASRYTPCTPPRLPGSTR